MKDKEYIILVLMTFFRYLGDCLFYGYLFLFLQSRGLNESNIGLISCLTPLIAIIINPLWNHFAKNVNINRIMMMVITVIEGVMIFVYTHCSGVETFLIVGVLLAMVASPFYNLHDGFCETFAEIHHKKYGRIRACGTLGYFVASLLAALILYLSNDNYNILLYMSSILMILTSFWLFFLKPIDLKLIIKEEDVNRNYKEVLSNKMFWGFALIDLLIVGISYVSDQYTSTYFINYQGVSATVWSFIYSGILLMEAIIILTTSKNKKLTPNIAYTILGLVYLIKVLAFALDLPLPVLIVCSFLRGVAYGLYLPACIKAIEQICGIKNVTCGCFIMGILTAIIRSISLFTFGNLINMIGYPNFFLIIFFIVLGGNIINIIFQIIHHFSYERVEPKLFDGASNNQ